MSMLTTVDNPINPYDDYESWYFWDQAHQYFCPQYLARVYTRLTRGKDYSDNPKMFNFFNEKAIDEILKFDFAGIYRRINEGDKVSVDDSDETEDVE